MIKTSEAVKTKDKRFYCFKKILKNVFTVFNIFLLVSIKTRFILIHYTKGTLFSIFMKNLKYFILRKNDMKHRLQGVVFL